MKNQHITKRMQFAIAGIKHAWLEEKSFRTQCVFALFWLGILALTAAPMYWWAIFLIIIGIILALELFNTAIEHLADHLHPEKHPMIKIVKDCAAGALLILSFNSVLLALLYLLYWLKY